MADLQRTLTNLRYLHERTEHCDVRALVDDFGLLDFADTRSSGAWREFLIRHAERLSHHRGLLFALVFYEGFDAARGQAEELSASGKWRKAWFRATKGWQPRQLRQEDDGWTVHVETECHSRGHSVAAIAGERGMAFHFQRLGQVGLTDLGSGQRLDYLLFVAQQRPLAMCCTTDGTGLVVAFENGDGEIWRISFDDAGRIAGCSAEPILFRYRVPEFEKPVLCVSGGRLWYQQESGFLAARVLYSSDVSECPVLGLIDLSRGELSSLCAVGLRMAGTFRTDGGTRLFLLDEGHMAALVHLRQVDVVTACSFGDDAVALALTDYSIRLLKIETAFTLLAQVKALPGNPRLSTNRLELTESPSVIVTADGGLFWITRNGHLFGWRPLLAASPAEIDARELKLEGPLAFDARPDGHFHVVTSYEARFSVGPGAGDARASVLAVFADPASCGDYRAFYEEDAGVAFVESSTRSTRIVETGQWRPHLSACDGTGCILGMNAAGQAMLIRPGDEEVTRAEYAVYGVASVAGHPDSGFWLADGVGTLWFLAPRHGISSVHRTQMADIGGQGLWCGRDLLVRSGVGKANRGRGTEDVYFVEFFWVQMDIGSVRARHERFFDPADGALTRVTVAPDGRRVWCFFGGGSVEPALVRTGSPEDFLNGTERMIPLRGDNPSPVQILNSPDGERLYVRSWAGDLYCLNGDTLGVEAVFSTPEPVTALSANTASDGSFIMVQAHNRVVFCHFQPA